MKKLIIYTSVIAIVIAGLMSCNDDFNTLGGNILGADELSDRIQQQDFEVTSYNALLNPVQTNNFSSFLIGTYNDPVYGVSSYDFVTQVSLGNVNPSFGLNARVDSVILSIPYFARTVGIENESVLYELDSVYGDEKIQLQIYENGYFLNDFDPINPAETAVYFNDLRAVVDANKQELLYETAETATTEHFLPSEKEIVEIERDDEGEIISTDRSAPAFRVKLDSDFWEERILDQEGTVNLQSNSDFQNYFRGLYFKMNGPVPGTDGNLTALNIQQGSINVHITFDIVDVGDTNNNNDTTELLPVETITRLELGGASNNRVNFIRNDFNPAIIADIQASNDIINGEENLYLKGGQGSMAIIELFGPDIDMNGEADELTNLKQNNWLLNDAFLTFYVDQSKVTPGATEPERIIIYNIDDNTLLADFPLGNTTAALNAATNHLGRIVREDNENEFSAGISYKIRITEHVRRILEQNQSNVRLGLAVSQNVTFITNSQIESQISPVDIESIPTSAAYSHEGTVLHGNLSPDPDKRLKLEIYYTPIED